METPDTLFSSIRNFLIREGRELAVLRRQKPADSSAIEKVEKIWIEQSLFLQT